MKKIILILLGISVLLLGVIFVLYQNHQSKNEEVIDIFTENKEEEKVIEESHKEITNVKMSENADGKVKFNSSGH